MPYEPAERFDQVSYAIRDVLGPARELEAQGHDVLKLNIGDPCAFDFEPPTKLLEAHRQGARPAGYSPSQGSRSAREAIARYERSRGVDVGAEDVVVTTGTSEALGLLLASVLDPGEEVLIPGPAYPPYVSLPLITSAQSRAYPCRMEDGWAPDPDAIRERIDEDTQALVVISPNNPTGATIPEDVLEEICEIAWEHELLLITDDIYWELSFGQRPTTAGAIGQGPVVVLDGLSKSWLVPGWRAGWMAFRDPDDELAGIKETVMKQARLRLCSPAPMQAAIANTLTPNADHLDDVRRRLRRRAETVYERVQSTQALSMAKPEGAFYAFVRIDDLEGSDKDWVLDLLEEEQVLTVHGSGFGDAGTGHFRMVYLPPVDVLEDAMDRIVRFAESR
ncbi:alanine aminotransferase [Thermoplasmatales archaeon SW_10_69_26]|nr:MAG: alanine aminotransferase [Thermoplasmatales archaeon SW_10_69_26]